MAQRMNGVAGKVMASDRVYISLSPLHRAIQPAGKSVQWGFKQIPGAVQKHYKKDV